MKCFRLIFIFVAHFAVMLLFAYLAMARNECEWGVPMTVVLVCMVITLNIELSRED